MPTIAKPTVAHLLTRGLHLQNGQFTQDLWVMRKDGSDLQRMPGSKDTMFFDCVY